jgi:predicted methyltransferase
MLKKLATVIISVNLILACEQPPEPKNEFERAVYNSQRMAEDKKQDERRRAAEILAFSRVKSGSKVLDFMAGKGYYSELFSFLVGPEGAVYLHNVPEKAQRKDILEAIKQRLANNRLPNVKTVSFTPTDFQLPEKVDLILLSKVFHDFFVPGASEERNQTITQFFQQLRSSLNKDGYILLIDHSAPKGSGTEFTSSNHRIDEAFVIDLFQQNGFKLVASTDLLRSAEDDRTLNIWDGKVRNKTDQFVLLFALQ